jgi:O-antigen ligase
LKLASYFWGFHILIPCGEFVIGVIPNQFAYTLVDCLYFSYLFAVYSTRSRTLRSIPGPLIPNRFGAATLLSIILVAWSGLSFAWTPAPVKTAGFVLDILAKVLISYLLCRLYPIPDVFRNVCKGTAYAASVLTPVAIVTTGFTGGRLGGEGSNAPGFGGVLASQFALGILSVIYLTREKALSRKSTIFILASIAIGEYLVFSKTDIIAFVVVGMVYAIFAPGTVRLRCARSLLAIITIFALWMITASKLAGYANRGENVDTLTGRTVLWALTVRQLLNGPWIRGFGFLAFRDIGPTPWHGALKISHAHNEFLQVWFNFGLVGVALVFGSYFALGYASFKVMKQGRRFLSVFIACMLVYYLIRGLTGASVFLCLLPVEWLVLFDCLASTPGAAAVNLAPNRSRTGLL